jgi:hypothetical protein
MEGQGGGGEAQGVADPKKYFLGIGKIEFRKLKRNLKT